MEVTAVTIENNFLENADEVLNIIQQEEHNFASRNKGSKYEIASTYGSSSLKTLFQYLVTSSDLENAVFKTLKDKYEFLPDSWMINKYVPGDYLVRHTDEVSNTWKIDLIILRSDAPHFKFYTQEFPQGKMIEELPGTKISMPIDTEHEVTMVGEDERPRYTLVLLWNF
jgi:hypothetical protein